MPSSKKSDPLALISKFKKHPHSIYLTIRKSLNKTKTEEELMEIGVFDFSEALENNNSGKIRKSNI